MLQKWWNIRGIVFCFVSVAACVLAGCAKQDDSARFVKSIEWAEKGQWLKADTHIHTRFSDGSHTVDEVVSRAVNFGCDCVAITDHTDANLKAGTPEYVEAINIARRQFPQTVIIAGLEWNVPPWGGREHATVLFPSAEDELRILADFKSNFDDFNRGAQPADLADRGLEWLAANAESRGIRPVVVYNHPNRKSESAEEIAPRIKHWRSVNDLVIGVEGAPGHQGATPLGAYKEVVKTIDRWDPAVAEIGGAWDQLLQQGSDVWGAYASSDFHNETGGDYWPGEFAETWLYVPERTAAGVLKAFRAGSFFGVHGHIAREVTLEVTAAGLLRPAGPGEVIEAPAASGIQAQVRFVFPERNWKGEANRIDEIELIAIDTAGARVAAQSRPLSPDSPLLAELTIPEGGMVLRARGRQVVADGPDLMFYTNPVRIITPGTPSWLSRLLGADRAEESGAGSASSVRLGIRECAGVGMLILTLVTLALSIRRTKSKPQQETRAPQPIIVDQIQPISPLRGTHYLVAAVILMALAAYGSFVPLNFRPAPLTPVWLAFQRMIGAGVRFHSRSDLVVNILLFVPIGGLALAGLTVGRPSGLVKLFAIPIVLIWCAATSCAVEFGQYWFPPRVPAINDIAAQFIGASIGVLLWLVLGRRVHSWLSGFLGAQQRQERIDRLLQLYALGLFLYGLFPLDLVTSPAELWHKYRDGKVRLRPLAEWDWTGMQLLGTATDVLLFIPIGALATRLFAGWSAGLRSMAPSVLLTVLFAGIIETCQLFVSSRYTKVDDILTAAVGGTIGAWWMHWYRAHHVSGALKDSEQTIRSPVAVWLIAALVYAVFLVLIFCQPFEPIRDSNVVAQRWQRFFAVPFSTMEAGSFFGAATQFLRKLLWFAPLGTFGLFVSRAWSRRPSRRQRVLALFFVGVTILAAGIELFQLSLIDHTPDLTDVLLYVSGAGCGAVTASFVMRGESIPERSTSYQPNFVYRGASKKTRWHWLLHRSSMRYVAIAGIVLFGLWNLRQIDAPIEQSASSTGRENSASTAIATTTTIFDEVQLSGTWFGKEPSLATFVPRTTRLELPEFPGTSAIWGATGRDFRGHIWFGVSASHVGSPSAHLFEFVPESNQVIDRGDVLSALKQYGRYQEGMGQAKIHSRIVQGGDGHLYFASMDEQGEAEDGSRLPTWGGHLWRMRLPTHEWEHLAEAPEALIAVAGYRDVIYALGYYGHVLYRFNSTTGEINSVRVGSVGGHVSRNLICDSRGHAFVPRVEKLSGVEGNLHASIVEFDPALRELARTPLEHYLHGGPEESHGIVGVQPMADRSIVFVTHAGFLYQIPVAAYEIPAVIHEIGWFHPEGPAYAPSLFTFSGTTYLVGVSQHLHGRSANYEWLLYNLKTRTSTASPFEVEKSGRSFSDLLLYGSTTRDNLGNFYLVGRYSDFTKQRLLPVVVRVQASL
jgi:glycopeptide antibiotics resistance protein